MSSPDAHSPPPSLIPPSLSIHSKHHQHVQQGLPSPPLSVTSDGLVDFDGIGLFSASSPPAFDLNSTPPAQTLVTPQGSPGPTSFGYESNDSPTSTVEALSAHHLERFLHYKTLAAQAQAELSISLLDGRLMAPEDSAAKDRAAMIALQSQPQAFFNAPPQGLWNQTFSYQQQAQQAQQQQHQQHVFAAEAQAQAHLQAHEAAQVQAAAQRMSMANYYMPSAPRPIDTQAAQPPPLWSRGSGSSNSVSTASPPFPATPTYAVAIESQQQYASIPEGENELSEEEFGSNSSDKSIPNHNGGGRGYVPGKTPDDPKKRHKCNICGRGFARAFNLKSHVGTHDPLRPKPHQCPHPMCKRSFSRLHDLERHRQGIHSDGPLVDAKRQGVSPSIVRAQSRMQRRAESGGLI